MHTRLAELLDATEEARRALLARVSSLDAPALARHENGGWSVAEILEHLAIVEAGTVRLLARRLERAKEQGLGRETDDASLLHSLDAFDLTNPRQPMEAPEIVRPSAAQPAAVSLDRLAESRAALRALVAAADGYALEGVRATHARLGDISMYEWVLFLGQHERRHLSQITRILGQPTS
jgi:DinB superfamily